MSKKRTKYTAEFKSKLVLELLKNERTLSEIASDNNITPQNLQGWKKIFLDNAVIAMEPSKVVKEYKDDLAKSQEENEMLMTLIGKVTIEKEWLEKKLKSLASSEKRNMIEPKLKALSLRLQCQLLGLNRSGIYYQKRDNTKKAQIQERIINIFENVPIYGAAKVHQQLLQDNIKISLNTVASYRKEMKLHAVLAVKQVNTTVPIKSHKKYSYKLRDLDINKANHVWSTDITYIKVKGGMVYLAAIIDWHSKAVLSHKISNTMDSTLVMDVLNDALARYDKPEIFNTDQGSQYTSEIHTARLKKEGITISMDGKGRATDNICIERFWRSAKCECIYLNEYDSISALKEDVNNYIAFYNHKRFHQTLDYKKPMDVYNESVLSSSALSKAA